MKRFELDFGFQLLGKKNDCFLGRPILKARASQQDVDRGEREYEETHR